MELTLKLAGILFGVLARTLVPYLRKMMAGKVDKFKKEYLATAVASFILSLIMTIIILPKFEFTQAGIGLEGTIKLFCTAFGFGFGWNSLVNEAIQWAPKKPKVKEEVPI